MSKLGLRTLYFAGRTADSARHPDCAAARRTNIHTQSVSHELRRESAFPTPRPEASAYRNTSFGGCKVTLHRLGCYWACMEFPSTSVKGPAATAGVCMVQGEGRTLTNASASAILPPLSRPPALSTDETARDGVSRFL